MIETEQKFFSWFFGFWLLIEYNNKQYSNVICTVSSHLPAKGALNHLNTPLPKVGPQQTEMKVTKRETGLYREVPQVRLVYCYRQGEGEVLAHLILFPGAEIVSTW